MAISGVGTGNSNWDDCRYGLPPYPLKDAYLVLVSTALRRALAPLRTRTQRQGPPSRSLPVQSWAHGAKRRISGLVTTFAANDERVANVILAQTRKASLDGHDHATMVTDTHLYSHTNTVVSTLAAGALRLSCPRPLGRGSETRSFVFALGPPSPGSALRRPLCPARCCLFRLPCLAGIWGSLRVACRLLVPESRKALVPLGVLSVPAACAARSPRLKSEILSQADR